MKIPVTADLLRGALDTESTDRGLIAHRLPAWVRTQFPDAQLDMAQSQPSGVRVAFRTAATRIELDVLPTKRVYVGLPARPDGVFDLFVDGRLHGRATSTGGDSIVIDVRTGAAERRPGSVCTLAFDLPGSEQDVEIWLPHNESVELIELRSDEPVQPMVSSRPMWVHYGSSISQGSNAATPSQTYPAVAASTIGAELLNLGFGGSAMLDPFMARVIRDRPADLISLEIGINIVNADAMRVRAFVPAVHGFLDTIRDGHPDTPLVVVSPIFCPIHENTPGPGAFDPEAIAAGRLEFMATGEPGPGKLTLTVIRDELARIVPQRAATDPNLHYVDGQKLYGENDYAAHPLPDNLHPDADTHLTMGARWAQAVREFEVGSFSTRSNFWTAKSLRN